MWKLPGGADAQVPREKVEGYLLSHTHPEGRTRARFFDALGFEAPRHLEAALRDLATTGSVTLEVHGEFGRKYVVDGDLVTPLGIRAPVRTVWIREPGSSAPRLVTAYPRQEATK